MPTVYVYTIGRNRNQSGKKEHLCVWGRRPASRQPGSQDSGNIFANKRKLNLWPRMASFVRPTSTKLSTRNQTAKESFYNFGCASVLLYFLCHHRGYPAPSGGAFAATFSFRPTHVFAWLPPFPSLNQRLVLPGAFFSVLLAIFAAQLLSVRSFPRLSPPREKCNFNRLSPASTWTPLWPQSPIPHHYWTFILAALPFFTLFLPLFRSCLVI